MNDTTEIPKPAAHRGRELIDETRLSLISGALKAAPAPAPKLTQKQALQKLSVDLRDALARGHTLASLADILRSQGVGTSERGIAQALQAGRSVKAAKATRPKALRACAVS